MTDHPLPSDDPSSGGPGRVAAVALSRRSVRDGYGAGPTDEELTEILAACLAAPSSKNARPWRLHVVRNPELLRRLADAVAAAEGIDDYVPVDPITGRPHERYDSTVLESADALRCAPLGIFIENSGEFSVGRSTLSSVPPANFSAALLGHGLEVLGIGGAIHAMWLTAVDLGLQGVFMGDVIIAEDAITRILGMQGDLIGVLVLGRAPSGEQRSLESLDWDRVVVHDEASSG